MRFQQRLLGQERQKGRDFRVSLGKAVGYKGRFVAFDLYFCVPRKYQGCAALANQVFRMKFAADHCISQVEQWKEIQERLHHRLIVAPFRPLPRFVAGVDAGFSEECQTVFAAAVVYDRERRTLAAVSHAVGRVEAPYVPGYLSFREGKAVLEAIGKLQHEFRVILFDGQGYAHPRRCGIASHLSLLMDRPGVGVAKSRLVGTYDPAGAQAGSSTPLMDGEEQIGLVLRARAATLSRCLSVSRIAWTSSRPKNSFWLAASATVSPNRRV